MERLLYREATAHDLTNTTAAFSVTSRCLRAMTEILALTGSERIGRARLNKTPNLSLLLDQLLDRNYTTVQ